MVRSRYGPGVATGMFFHAARARSGLKSKLAVGSADGLVLFESVVKAVSEGALANSR